MMREAERRPAHHPADYVQVRSLGGQSQRQRGQRRVAIEAGASHAGAGQKVSDRFQAMEGFYSDNVKRATGIAQIMKFSE
jgi:hypothetical protein